MLTHKYIYYKNRSPTHQLIIILYIYLILMFRGKSRYFNIIKIIMYFYLYVFQQSIFYNHIVHNYSLIYPHTKIIIPHIDQS